MKKLLLLTVLIFGLHAESVTELTKACNLNDAKACTKLGSMYEFGNKANNIKKDNLKVKKYFTKACDLNYGKGCNSLASYYSREEHDNAKSYKYAKKACDLNYGKGCTKVGLKYMIGRGIKKDFFKAQEYFKKGCELKDSMGCSLYKN